MIYAIGCKQFVKFGQSAFATSKARLETLQTGNPFELILLVDAQWPDKEEKRIHRFLAEHRIRGEWFAICERSQQVIDAMHGPLSAWHNIFIQAHPPRLRKAAEFYLARAFPRLPSSVQQTLDVLDEVRPGKHLT